MPLPTLEISLYQLLMYTSIQPDKAMYFMSRDQELMFKTFFCLPRGKTMEFTARICKESTNFEYISSRL